MLKFRTEIEVAKSDWEIDYSTPVALLGSCFTDEIGNRLVDGMFDISVNPFGPLFNPISIAQVINETLDGKIYNSSELVLHQGKYHCLMRHSRFSDSSQENALTKINNVTAEFASFLKRCKYLIVTFGSSIGFKEITSSQIVANCHKIHPAKFERVEISISEIVNVWTQLIMRLRNENTNLRIILTVSPVRHIGYGLPADRLSKSRLIVSCHELSEIDYVRYFPSYEAINDDLRDYRFYAEDLVHPGSQAVEYVYDIFNKTFMHPSTIDKAYKWSSLCRRLRHRHQGDETYKVEFDAETLRMAEELSKQFSNPSALIERFNQYLKKCR